MNDMRPITTDKKVLTPNNILIPQTNRALKKINNNPNGFVSVDVYSGIIIPTTQNSGSINSADGSVQSAQFSNAASDDLVDQNQTSESGENNRVAQNYDSEVINANDYNENNTEDNTQS